MIHSSNQLLSFKQKGSVLQFDAAFDRVIAFPEAVWIGDRSSNPQGSALEIPEAIVTVCKC